MNCCTGACNQGRDCPNRTTLQAFSIFWNIRLPSFLTRLSASLTCREKQDAALYCASLIALCVVAANV